MTFDSLLLAQPQLAADAIADVAETALADPDSHVTWIIALLERADLPADLTQQLMGAWEHSYTAVLRRPNLSPADAVRFTANVPALDLALHLTSSSSHQVPAPVRTALMDAIVGRLRGPGALPSRLRIAFLREPALSSRTRRELLQTRHHEDGSWMYGVALGYASLLEPDLLKAVDPTLSPRAAPLARYRSIAAAHLRAAHGDVTRARQAYIANLVTAYPGKAEVLLATWAPTAAQALLAAELDPVAFTTANLEDLVACAALPTQMRFEVAMAAVRLGRALRSNGTDVIATLLSHVPREDLVAYLDASSQWTHLTHLLLANQLLPTDLDAMLAAAERWRDSGRPRLPGNPRPHVRHLTLWAATHPNATPEHRARAVKQLTGGDFLEQAAAAAALVDGPGPVDAGAAMPAMLPGSLLFAHAAALASTYLATVAADLDVTATRVALELADDFSGTFGELITTAQTIAS